MRHFSLFVCLLGVVGCSGSTQDPANAANGGNGGTSGNSGSSGSAGSSGTSSAGTSNGGSSGSGGGSTPIPADDLCQKADIAFCDEFKEKSPGGRAGDLDDSKWSFSRLGFGCANTFAFPATPVNFCGVWNTVPPGGPDSAFCRTENDEPRWTEGFHDNLTFQYISARIRQPFDFADRTGTIQWQADARTSGSHGWWVETWITEEPVPGATLHGGLHDSTDQLVSGPNAIGIVMALNCGVPAQGLGTNGAGKTGVDRILVVKDYVWDDVYDPFTGPQANSRCVSTEQGEMNTFHFKLSQHRIEVYGSSVGESELIPLAEADIDLAFTRGYVAIDHVHYNAHKAEVPSYQSYQWARVAFDGPKLPTPRAYEIPDPLSEIPAAETCGPEAVYRIAYGVSERTVYDLGNGPTQPATLAFEGVDLADATGARLNFNTSHVRAGDVVSYRFNGGTWRDYTVPAINTSWERQGFTIPVAIEDLVSGTNGIEFGAQTQDPPNRMDIANMDLEVLVP